MRSLEFDRLIVNRVKTGCEDLMSTEYGGLVVTVPRTVCMM